MFWVAHLRITVYKGIGKDISSQRPAMNFDRSAVSLRLTMGYICLFLFDLILYALSTIFQLNRDGSS